MQRYSNKKIRVCDKNSIPLVLKCLFSWIIDAFLNFGVLTVVLKYLNPAKVYRIHDWTLEKLHSCEMSLKESLKLKVWRFSRKKNLTKNVSLVVSDPECILVWCRGMPRAGSRGVGRSYHLNIKNYPLQQYILATPLGGWNLYTVQRTWAGKTPCTFLSIHVPCVPSPRLYVCTLLKLKHNRLTRINLSISLSLKRFNSILI